MYFDEQLEYAWYTHKSGKEFRIAVAAMDGRQLPEEDVIRFRVASAHNALDPQQPEPPARTLTWERLEQAVRSARSHKKPPKQQCEVHVSSAPATPTYAELTDGSELLNSSPCSELREEEDSDDEDEMDISGLDVGMVILAKGLGPANGRELYKARITKFRKKFPPIQVCYLATHPDGDTNPLRLPASREAAVHKADIEMLEG